MSGVAKGGRGRGAAQRRPMAGTVEPGDHVYAHHPERGPVAMKVLAHGRDGFTGQTDDGGRHAMPWGRMLGAKSRVAMEWRVRDAGAEGAIVEDGKGRTRFLSGDLSPDPSAGRLADGTAEATGQAQRDPLLDGIDRLGKALATSRAIFLKAGPMTNRPGLQLKDVTDRAGHQTRRWVRAVPDHPGEARKPGAQAGEGGGAPEPMRHGDHVAFRHGGVEGSGRIVGSGRDGVTVRAADGRQHIVRHDDLVGPAADDPRDLPDHRPGGVSGPIPPARFGAAAFAAAHDRAEDATVAGVLRAFPPDTRERMDAVENRLRDLPDTVAMHRKGGEWTPERTDLHTRILSHFLSPERVRAATPDGGKAPTFTILGGRGGSGKSWFKGQVYDPDRAIVLDADEIKHMLPEYEGWNAAQVHEESGDLFDRITELAAAEGLNIVHDATMKTPAKAVALVKGFKERGYRTEAHYMHLPRAEAAKRAVKRFLGPTGRYVPVEVILANTKNEHAFDQVKGLVDRWSFRDNQNTDGAGPRVVSESAHEKADGKPGSQGRAEAPSGGDARADGRAGLPPAGRTQLDPRDAAAPQGQGAQRPDPAPGSVARLLTRGRDLLFRRRGG